MASINIPRYIQDPFYRYTMPSLQLSFHKGNTVISNLDSVSHSLGVPSSYILKFMSLSLSTSCQSSSNIYSLRGSFHIHILNTILDTFIQNFVLCPHDLNPETTIYKKNKHLSLICKSCGNSTVISSNDKIIQKMMDYIVKN